MNINKAIVVGRLTRDPEMKALPNGSKVTNMSIATSRNWVSDGGEKREVTEFHNIVVFNRVAETCAQYLKKGQMCGVEGRLQTRTWDDQQSGKKMYRTEIVAEQVQFGPKPGQNNAGGGEPVIDAETGQSRPTTRNKPSQAPAVVPPGQQKISDDQIEYPTEEINPDDIPF